MSKVLFGMMVRERRRIVTLAKAAASLDERLVSTEKLLSISESVLRAQMDEHRHEVAELEQKQHDHILSLMCMVHDDSHNATNVGTTENNSEPSEMNFQKKLLVLANERVAVLEGQLAQLDSISAANVENVEKINELNVNLMKKTEYGAWVELQRDKLRSGLRLIRDEADRYSRQDCANTSNFDLVPFIVGLVDNFLESAADCLSDEPTNMHSSMPKNHGIDSSGKSAQHALSPRFKMQMELLASSDSESVCDEASLECSSNLFTDLFPLSSGQFPNVTSTESTTEGVLFNRLSTHISVAEIHNTSSKRQDSGDREETGHSGLSSEIKGNAQADDVNSANALSGQIPYQSVFDRLGSPSQYTGTQKERYHDAKTKRDRSSDPLLPKTAGGFKEMSDQSEDTAQCASDRSEYVKLNVFDRLQKTTTQAAAIRQNETMHAEVRTFSDTTGSTMGGAHGIQPNISEVEPSEGKSITPTSETGYFLENGETRAGIDRAAYAKQNVFDRLQKTTTLATAVRQSETLHSEGRATSHSSSTGENVATSKKLNLKRLNVASDGVQFGPMDLKKESVFDRLNKATTETFAKKTHRTKNDDLTPSRSNEF